MSSRKSERGHNRGGSASGSSTSSASWSPRASMDALRRMRPGAPTHMRDLVKSKVTRGAEGFDDVVLKLKRFKAMDRMEKKLREMADAARTAISVDKLMGDSSVLVAMRIRVFLPSDPTKVTCLGDGETPNTVRISDKNGKSHDFKIDAVLNEMVPQATVYSMTAKRILVKVLAGYNGTVFAYGQTGSGKTFTMLGPDGATRDDTPAELLGIIPRAVKDLFQHIGNHPATVFTVKASYIEIYREEIIDLMSTKKASKKNSINIRQQPNGDVVLDGAKMESVDSLRAVMRLIERGNRHRQVGGHALNANSSRSHAVFTLYIEQATMKGGKGIKLLSKFNLIDLAGSERAKRTGATGDRLKEGSSINQSLSALGNVIKALTDGVKVGKDGKKKKRKKGSKLGHVPFRNSVLTRLLQDSLGGSAYTLMVCNCAPGKSHYHETLSSLRFAERVKLVTNTVTINQQDLSPSQAKELVSENEELRKRLEELQHRQSFMMEEQLQTNNQAHEEELAEVRRHEEELRMKVERAEHQAHMLMHLTKATAKHDMNQIRKIVNDSVGDILCAEGARVFLIDKDTEEIWCPVHLPKARNVKGADASSSGDDDSGDSAVDGDDGDEDEIRVKLESSSIATHVAKEGNTASVQNIASNERWSPSYNPNVDFLTKGQDPNSMLVMPIVDEVTETVIGVISVYNKKDGLEWSRDDRSALGVLCSHVFTEVNRQVHGISETSGFQETQRKHSIAALSSTYHEQLLEVSTGCTTLLELAEASEALLLNMLEGECEYASLHYLVEKGTDMVPAGQSRDDAELWDPVSNIRVSKWTGILGQVATEKEPLMNVSNADELPHFERQSDRHPSSNTGENRRKNQSMLIVPLHRIESRHRSASTASTEPPHHLERKRSLSIVTEGDESDDDEAEAFPSSGARYEMQNQGPVLAVLRIGYSQDAESKDSIVGFSQSCEEVLKSIRSYVEAGISICLEHEVKEKERQALLKEKKVAAAQMKKAMTARRASTFRHTAELSLAKKEVAKKIKNIEKVQEQRINTVKLELSKDFTKERSELVAEHNHEIESMKASFEKQLGDLKKKLTHSRTQMDDMFEQYQNEKNEMKFEFRQTVEVYESDKAEASERIAVCEEELSTAVEQHREELAETVQRLRTQHEEETARLLDRQDASMKTARQRHEKQLAAALKSASSSGSTEKMRIIRDHTRAIADLEKEQRKKLKDVRHEYQLMLEASRRESNEALAKLRSSSQAERYELEAKIEDVERIWEEKLENEKDEQSAYRERMKTEQEETMISHQNEVKKLQEQLVVARNEASSELERTITDIQAKHSEKLSALMAEHREAMDELREEVNSKDGDVNKTVTALGEEKVSRRLSQFKHAANVAKTNKYKKQIEELQEELGEARAQAVRLHDQIKQEKKHSLDMKKDYESQLKQNAHQLREKFNAHTASLSEEHAAVLNDLSKSHINELGAVKNALLTAKTDAEKVQRHAEAEAAELREELALTEGQRQNEVAILENQLRGVKAKIDLLQETCAMEQEAMTDQYENLEEERDEQVLVLRGQIDSLRIELEAARKTEAIIVHQKQEVQLNTEDDRRKMVKWANRIKIDLERNTQELTIRASASNLRQQKLITALQKLIESGPKRIHGDCDPADGVLSPPTKIELEKERRDRRDLKDKREREERERVEAQRLQEIERKTEAEDLRLKAEAAKQKDDAARKRMSAQILHLEGEVDDSRASLNRVTRTCGEKHRELKKLRMLIREMRRNSRKTSNITVDGTSDIVTTSTEELSPTSKARTLSRLEMDRDEAERGLNAADSEKRLLKQRIENTEQELAGARDKLLSIERQANARRSSGDAAALTRGESKSEIDVILDSALVTADAMAALTLKREQSAEAFMRQVAEMRVSVERQVGQYRGLLDNNELRVEAERRRAEDLVSRLAEADERCKWLESMLKMPSANDLRTSQSEIDFLRTKLAQHQNHEAHLVEQSDKLRDDLHSSQDRVALLERMMHIPALRKSSDLAMTKRQRSMTQRLSTVTAIQSNRGGGDDPFDQPLLSTWSSEFIGTGGEEIKEDPLFYTSSNSSRAAESSLPVAAVAGDDEGDIGEDYFDSANRNRRTNVEQASAVSVTESERGPLRVERLSTEHEQNRTTPSRHVSTNHVSEVASTSPRFTPAGRPKQKTKLRAWAPTSPSASAQDAKHSAAQDYGDRGRDLNSYTFLLQQRMGSPSTSGNSRSPSRVGSQPRVEVFTSTLHTVFMAFANRTTLTMGKTGFRRFGIECPGLIKPLSRSHESVIDEGHLQVIYSRAVPRNGKSRRQELNFASFVDALLWISIVKFPQQDISLAFWRLITEHVFLFAFVPQQVQALAHANASTKLAKLVLRQGSGRDF